MTNSCWSLLNHGVAEIKRLNLGNLNPIYRLSVGTRSSLGFPRHLEVPWAGRTVDLPVGETQGVARGAHMVAGP